MITKNLFLNFFGIFYIVIACLAFFNAIEYYGGSAVLWFSYFAFLLVGIGIFTRNSYLIGSQLNIIFIPYIVWSIDFIYHFTTSKSLWGITDYVFTLRHSISQLVTIQHLFIIPIALIALYFIKFKRKDYWKMSLVQVVVIFLLTIVLSDQTKNVNCVFKNCLPFELPLGVYQLIWFIGFFVMIFLVNFALVRIKALSKENSK